MKSNKRRINLLVVLMAHAITFHLAGAFQLWPNRLTKALSNRHESNMNHKASARAPAPSSSTTTTTTTTTTSTTTPLPPIELHFEIDPEELDQHRETETDPSDQQSANGTLILEDLVNQLRNNINLKQLDDSAYPANRSAQYRMGDSAEQTDAIGDQDDKESNMNDLLVNTSSYPPDLDPDRHIQYDPIVAPSTPEYNPKLTQELTGQRLDYKLDSRQAVVQPAPQNFTLGTVTELVHNITDVQQVSSPLIIVSAARNVSVSTITPSPSPSSTPKSSNSSSAPHQRPEKETGSSNHTSSRPASSSGQAQARSMNSGRLLSKAPYASYNHHSDYKPPIATTPNVGESKISHQTDQLASSSSSSNNKSTEASDSNDSELANSVTKISSNLIGDAANNDPSTTPTPTSTSTTSTTSTTTPRPPTSVDQLLAYLNGERGNNFINRLEQRNEFVSKLTPVNELIDLDPLPSMSKVQTTQPVLSERHYTSPGQHYQSNLQISDASSNGSDSQPFSIHDNGNTNDRDDLASQILQMKTIEMLSSQIKHSDSGLLAASSNTMAVHQHKERSPPQQQQHVMMSPVNREVGGLGGGTFAASLINITAPMVQPMSASEAMEASMASLNKHHSNEMNNHHRVGSSQSQQQHHAMSPHRSNYYVVPPSIAHESIYSKPMNQFRPTTRAPHHPSDGYESTGGQSGSSSHMSAAERDRMLTPSQLASGFRSPLNQYQAATQTTMMGSGWPHLASSLHTNNIPTPASYLTGLDSAATSAISSSQAPTSVSTTTPSSAAMGKFTTPATPAGGSNRDNQNSIGNLSRQPNNQNLNKQQVVNATSGVSPPTTTNGFITGTVVNTTMQSSHQVDLIGAVTGAGIGANGAIAGPAGSVTSQVVAGGGQQQQQQQQQQNAGGAPKRAFNLTRVEHISAECSNDLIRTIIIFNGTFKGIIYSSGYVSDPNCLYINGTGKTRYDFSIRLNQCGTLGRQELHSASGPDEVRRRDQVMWNSLSIQYNPIIEQEWDEHFKVSCEYGSDFWKTISFSPFNVETNTGSPVVFTVDPPQCQMEILKGHGMVGPRQEAISGPVTVGDPLTLLIHMKSEKAGYDILVKNCIAHNGGQQKMQLIDSNGCVVNERFISSFRGTYNDNDLKHVTLYSYLKAFRFTGSPVLYLECEVHMCQSACPPQMCYWRRLSKRSAGNANETSWLHEDDYHELAGLLDTPSSTTTKPAMRMRTGKQLKQADAMQQSTSRPAENLSDKISLFQALEVRQERFPDPAATSLVASSYRAANDASGGDLAHGADQPMCYQRVEIFAFLFTVASILLAAVSVTIGCYCRASSLKRQSMTMSNRREPPPICRTDATKLRHALQKYPRAHQLANSLSIANSANLCYGPMSSASSSVSSSPLSSPVHHVDSSKRSFNLASPYSNLVPVQGGDTSSQVYGGGGGCGVALPSSMGAFNKGDNPATARHNRTCRPLDSLGVLLDHQRQLLAQNQKHQQLFRTNNKNN